MQGRYVCSNSKSRLPIVIASETRQSLRISRRNSKSSPRVLTNPRDDGRTKMKKLSTVLFLSFIAFSAYAEDKKSHFKNEASVGESVVANSQNEEDEELLAVASGSSESFIPQTTKIEPAPQVEYLWPNEETSEKPTYRLITPPSWDPSWSERQADPLTWSDVGRNINNQD